MKHSEGSSPRKHVPILLLVLAVVVLLGAAGFFYYRRGPGSFVLADGPGLQGPEIDALVNANRAYEKIVQAVLPTVVAIQSTQVVHVQQSPFMNPFFQQFFGNIFPSIPREEKQRALGSGTIVSPDGYILTNNHVIAHATSIQVVLHDQRSFKGKVVGADPDSDIAVVKIDAKGLTAATLGDSSQVHAGDTVLAFGNPFMQYFTVTRGIVSALARASMGPEPYPENFIQTDAAINPGNSGGALVNVRGQIIGIPTYILSGNSGPGGEGGSLGIGFAIPVNTAKHVMEDLIKTGKVTRGYLGAEVGALDEGLAKEFNVPDLSGALVESVQSGSPAAKAGLKSGDVIRTFRGMMVAGPDQLTADVMDTNPGTTVTVGILRNGKPMDLRVTMGQRPSGLGLTGQSAPAPSSGTLAGITVQNLTASARSRLGLPESVQGVVITNLDPNSLAAQAGLMPGDVILDINRMPVRNVSDFDQAASQAKGRVLLRVIHQGQAFYIVLSP
jgi:serine protease Do